MKNAIMKGASILTGLFLISMLFTPFVGAAPINPDHRYGNALPASAGDYVTAFIDGVQYGTADFACDGAGAFSVVIDGDDLDDPTFKMPEITERRFSSFEVLTRSVWSVEMFSSQRCRRSSQVDQRTET
jgi:hypothetical protein